MKSLFKILFLFTFIPAFGQDNEYTILMDTTAKGYNKLMPTGVRIGADLLGPVLYLFDDKNLSYEFTAEVDFDRYYLVAEYGNQQYKEVNDNVDYNMKGSFYRIGPDVNFLHSDNLLNSFTFGVRYAWGTYNEKVVGTVNEPNWGGIPVNFDVDNNSWWLEMTTGVKVRLVKGFFMGYTLRFRFLRRSTEPNVPFDSYYVPGFGLADRPNTWGFRYYVFYRFQWAKKPIRPKRNN